MILVEIGAVDVARAAQRAYQLAERRDPIEPRCIEESTVHDRLERGREHGGVDRCAAVR